MARLSPFPSPMPSLALSIIVPLFFSFSTASIGDLLQEHGLPGGLLPKAVESFAHDPSSGLLEVLIDRPCYARYEDGLAFFDREVRGNLSYGALQGVVGWSQEELFLWLPVKEIVIADSDSGVILFDIGVARKRFPVSSFEDPPDCLPVSGEAAAEAGDPLAGKAFFSNRDDDDDKIHQKFSSFFLLTSLFNETSCML